MVVTPATWIVGIVGIVLIGLLMTVQFIAVMRPRAAWTITNVYGGNPDDTDPTAYFAFNRGFAWADVFFWGPIQMAGSLGMIMGHRWGFLLALLASVPYVYTAILIFIWDRDMGFRQNTLYYWTFIWASWPVFGVVEMVYCFARLV